MTTPTPEEFVAQVRVASEATGIKLVPGIWYAVRDGVPCGCALTVLAIHLCAPLREIVAQPFPKQCRETIIGALMSIMGCSWVWLSGCLYGFDARQLILSPSSDYNAGYRCGRAARLALVEKSTP